ncbi:MAG TPA: histone deacetylase, partial [bacterium]|nr:histone deacetylase [bacterium]
LDIHHGNGTQDIFQGRKEIVYVSLHQHPLYPGTGLVSRDNCYNFPLPPETGGETWLGLIRTEVRKIIRLFSPGALGISLGLDTLSTDPLGGWNISTSDFMRLGEEIASWKLPSFGVLEGGYGPETGTAFKNFINGWLE